MIPDDDFKNLLRASTPADIRNMIVSSNSLIHETEQLLRGQKHNESVDLREALENERKHRQLMREELDRRNDSL